MDTIVINKLLRVEGILRVILANSVKKQRIYLESGQSVHTEERMRGKYPLEAIQLTQLLSAKSGIAHAIASVSALENYLQLETTDTAMQIRQVLLKLSTIYSHIQHFYWELLPDYLNKNSFNSELNQSLRFYIGFLPESEKPGDLSPKTSQRILKNISTAAKALNFLQKSITLIGGKHPVIMNLIPGGITNFYLKRSLIMKVIRNLEQIKHFVEVVWPQDIKNFIQDLPETVSVLVKSVNLISYGSLQLGKRKEQLSVYSDGVLLDGKLEPVNELKITESLDYTFYLPLAKDSRSSTLSYDINKQGARTWIKGARYDTDTMVTGALARMLVTHFGGGNLEVSDLIGQMIDDLGLSTESPNCIASRMLAEVFEARFYLKATLSHLLDLDDETKVNQQTAFDFSTSGSGTGKVEAPGGSLLHQVYINNNQITQYNIIAPLNWNFSARDEAGNMGIVENELNKLHELDNLTAAQASRILHSYNVQVVDGTQ